MTGSIFAVTWILLALGLTLVLSSRGSKPMLKKNKTNYPHESGETLR